MPSDSPAPEPVANSAAATLPPNQISPSMPALFTAQALVLAVQDATDHLRATTTVAHAAIGAALAHYIATGDTKHMQVVDAAQGTVTAAIGNLDTLTKSAISNLSLLNAKEVVVPAPRSSS